MEYYIDKNKQMLNALVAHHIPPTKKLLFIALKNALCDEYGDCLEYGQGYDAHNGEILTRQYYIQERHRDTLHRFSVRVDLHTNAIIYYHNGDMYYKMHYSNIDLLAMLARDTTTIYNDVLTNSIKYNIFA